MSYLHYTVDAAAESTIRVNIVGQARVRLMDQLNYFKYKRGKACESVSEGVADNSPVMLKPPYKGQWHIIVDTGGKSGDIKASVETLDA